MSQVTKKKILVSDNLSTQGIELLKGEPDFIVDIKTGMSEDELVQVIGDYDALIVRSETKVTRRVIEAASRLIVIGRAGIGLDNVDVDAASKQGIIAMNTPEGNILTTAEHTLSLLLSLARNIPQANISMHDKKWEKKHFMGVEVFDKTLGIIGLGRVGGVFARLARAMCMKVIAYDPFISLQAAKGMEIDIVSFDELLKKADFISVHTPLTRDTRQLLNDDAFSKMKKGVRIINCARGGIIDEEALLCAIDKGTVAGAALDVFESEPPAKDNPLIKHPKVICTPHLGASTFEAQEKVALAIAEQIIDLLKTGTVKNAVNAPSVSKEILVKIEPYLVLAEKLGKIVSQTAQGRLEKVEIQYSGDVILEKDISFMTIAAIKGILEPTMRDQVNYVNAPVIARNRNIQTNEVRENRDIDYSNMITVILHTDTENHSVSQNVFSISGTVFRKNQLRIVALDNFPIETPLSDNMIILYNEDLPGVIGEIGTILGEAGINIGSMNLGLNTRKGLAFSIINTDIPAQKETLEALRRIKHVTSVKMVKV